MNETAIEQKAEPAKRLTFGKVIGLMLLTVLLSSVIAVVVVYYLLFPGPFKPVTLSEKESQQLEQKLERLEKPAKVSAAPLEPERYSEAGASREISFSERELNALLAKNTDLAQKLAIDLSDNLASAKLLVPMDPDFPILGGKTVRINAGMEMRFANGRPVVILKGVSLWGVPLPNAWLGNNKNIDLVKQYGNDKGFWKAFADGVDSIEVKEGSLQIKLKE